MDRYQELLLVLCLKVFFSFEINKEHYEDYISEKLRLSDSDSIYITDMINGVFSELKNIKEKQK